MKAVDTKELRALSNELVEDLLGMVKVEGTSSIYITPAFKDETKVKDYMFHRLQRYATAVAARAIGSSLVKKTLKCRKCGIEYPKHWDNKEHEGYCPTCNDIYFDLTRRYG